MHVNVKKLALAAMMLALTLICMVMGSILQTSTFFFLAAASYSVGIVIRESSIHMGAMFYVAAVLLGGILAPDKYHVVSFALMGFYVVMLEFLFPRMIRIADVACRKRIFFVVRIVLFNVMYVPMIVLFQKVVFGKMLGFPALVGMWVLGQGVWWCYDRAYEYVQAVLWTKLRSRIIGS
jgi:hypothetical protein